MSTHEKQALILEMRRKRALKKQRKHRKKIISLVSVLTAAAVTAGAFVTASAKEVRITEINEFDGTNRTKKVYTVRNDSVGDILGREDLVVNDTDRINVDINSDIEKNSDIVITRGKEITIVANGVEQSAVVTKADAVEALVEAGHVPGENDEIRVENGNDLTDGDKIELISVSTTRDVANEEISNSVEYVDDPDMYEGETKVIDEGQAGNREIVSDVTYRSGEESERNVVSDNVTVEAKNKVVAVGTKKKPTPAPTSAPASTAVKTESGGGDVNGIAYSKKLTMTATAYSTSPSENGGYSVSAMGNPLRHGIVAVDPAVIPLGSKVYVTSADGSWTYGYATAEDTGGAIKGNKIDLCYDGTPGEVNEFGRQSCIVYIVE